MIALKNLWDLRYVFRMLLVFALVVGLLGWALVNYPKYVGVGFLILVGLIVANQPRVRRERERVDKLVETAFHHAYARLSPPPAMERSYSYSYPAFEIKFRSKLDMEAAATGNNAFKAEIGKIFKGYGPRSRPFNADMAVSFTYPGDTDELLARYKPHHAPPETAV